MTGSHVALDHVLLAVFVLVTLVEWRWHWPRRVRAIAEGVPGARAVVYRNIAVAEWGLTGCVIGLWTARGRPWAALMLGSVAPLRLGIGLVPAALVLGLLWLQRRALLARPERLERLRQKLDYADPLLPRTLGERRGFTLAAITAGICEEVFFRGFVMWYVGVWTGPVLAVAISSATFGFGHIYLGLPQVPRTAVIGAAFALIVLAAGSLWPAMIIHAAVDLNSGNLGFRALAGARAAEPDLGAPPTS